MAVGKTSATHELSLVMNRSAISVFANGLPQPVLQPGWYRLVRSGHAASAEVPKTPLISAISGRTSAG